MGFGDDKVDGESDHGRIEHHRIPFPVTRLVLQNWIGLHQCIKVDKQLRI